MPDYVRLLFCQCHNKPFILKYLITVGVHVIQDTLDSWAPITALDSLRLLLSDFPCSQIRHHAVRSLKNVSSDEMCDYLPQLVQVHADIC